MRLTWNLFIAQARQQRVRFALTALAIMAAVGVVLWVVSAYEAIASRFDDQTAAFVGDYSTFVVPKNVDDGLSDELVAALRSDPSIAQVNPVAQFRMWFRRVGEPPSGTVNRRGLGVMGPSVVGTTAHEPRYELIDGRWLDPASETETVVSSGVADALMLRPGDEIEFQSEAGGVVRLTVVGITEQVEGVEFAMIRTTGGAPGGVNRGPASLAAYVPMPVVESLTGKPPKLNLLELRLDPGASVEELEETLSAVHPQAELIQPEDVLAKVSSGFEAEGARKQAYFVTAFAILASAFIIFTTLSMGVNEKSRQLAVLRAVGLRRSQVASLVLVEAIVLVLFGWAGGLAGGWVLLKLLSSASPETFSNGISPDATAAFLAGACSLLGALLASILPIWRATRISPLEALAPVSIARRGPQWYVALGLASLVLIAINPALVFLIEMPERLRFVLIMGVGVPTTVAGFVLLAPIAVIAVENLFGPLTAGLLRLHGGLVRTQLSGNMWRSAGIAASLTLGLGLYTATQVWGWSMLGGFLPGRWTPNTIVKFSPPLSTDAIEKVRGTQGVESDAFLPVVVEQTRLAGDPLQSRARDSAVRQGNVVLVGLDAVAAFGGENPPFDLSFVEGDPEQAIAQLKSGRHCLVPDTFLKYAGLGVGDRIGLIPPQANAEPIEYTIAGVIAEPGSNWITKTSGLRKNSVRTAGIVFAPRQTVRADFKLPEAEFFWFDVASGVTGDELRERLLPLTSGGVGLTGETSQPRGRENWRGIEDKAVKVTLISDVRNNLVARGGSAVQAMGWLPLITLLVVSVGMVNTIAASVRARRWEFGILRSVGLTRWGLSRLVISEAILVAFTASVLSLIFGIIIGGTCLGLIGYVSNAWFEGVATPLTIPWSQLAAGYALCFALCLLAALWPAISAGRSEPLALMKAGRGSE